LLIYSKDLPTGRVYCLEDDGLKVYFPSVTTVLSKLTKDAIETWRERVGEKEADEVSQRAKDKGTAFHALLEKYVKKEPIDRSQENPMVLDDFDMITPLLDDHLGEVITVEEILYSFRLNTAGRVDLIGKWDGIPMVVDFKTSKKEKKRADIIPYFLQASCYAMMYNELHNTDIQDFVIVMANKYSTPMLYYGKVDNYKPYVEQLFIKGI
jgi:diacylglycerol kinase